MSENELSEKQKMLQGLAYFPSNKQLQKERAQAKKQCQLFNQHDIDERKGARRIIKDLFGAVGSAWIEPPFYCDYGYNIRVGNNFYANHGLVILDAAPVTIGDDVMIAPGVIISTATHPLDALERRKGIESARQITIGNNVWLGAGVKILDGVIIGDNSVIAAGAVVTKNVPANSLGGGVPARLLRSL